MTHKSRSESQRNWLHVVQSEGPHHSLHRGDNKVFCNTGNALGWLTG